MTSALVERDALQVRGPDAESFLQGQLSQDVAALPAGQSTWSFVLQPQGKVDALVRVTRLDGETFLLDVDGGHGAALAARLNRFKLRVNAEIAAVDWVEAATQVQGRLPGDERSRIEAGWPRMGAELTEATIPAETGLVDRTVSFTKGCFTGQELVARIDSRGGNVPRHLRGIRLGGTGAPVGAEVVVEGSVVGTLTSVADDVALAYIGRAVQPPVDATVRWDGGETTARVEALPLT